VTQSSGESPTVVIFALSSTEGPTLAAETLNLGVWPVRETDNVDKSTFLEFALVMGMSAQPGMIFPELSRTVNFAEL
jgi:hypothetical protein